MSHTNTQSEAPATGGRTHLSFDRAERKKVVILLALLVVGGLVIGYQVWPQKGPATAQAGELATVAGANVNLDDLIQQLRKPEAGKAAPSDANGKLLLKNVDEALEVFLAAPKAKPVPIGELRNYVFGLHEDYLKQVAAVADETPEVEQPKPAVEDKKPPAEDPNLAQLAKLHLETVLVSSRNQAAIINGQVLHSGETVGGFEITEITRGHVGLDRDGKKYELNLK